MTDASPSTATCSMANCFKMAKHDTRGIFFFLPRFGGDTPVQSLLTARNNEFFIILQSLGEFSMLSLYFSAIASHRSAHIIFELGRRQLECVVVSAPIIQLSRICIKVISADLSCSLFTADDYVSFGLVLVHPMRKIIKR